MEMGVSWARSFTAPEPTALRGDGVSVRKQNFSNAIFTAFHSNKVLTFDFFLKAVEPRWGGSQA